MSAGWRFEGRRGTPLASGSSAAPHGHRAAASRRSLLAAAALVPAAARAADFPARSVRIIVPYGPGGSSDIVARILAQRATELSGQPFLVENRGGGASVPGTQALATALPDGYTVGTADNALVLNPAVLKERLPYDTEREIGALGLAVTAPVLLLAHPSAAARSVADLVAEAAARPGLGLSHGGIGTPTQLAVMQMQLATGRDYTPVGYRGGGPQLVGLVAGEVPYGFVAVSAALQQVQSGRLRPLGVSGTVRTPLLPEVPSMAEAGVPGVDVLGWWGLITPVGLAVDLQERLHALLLAPAREGLVKAKLEGYGYTVVANTPAEYAVQIRREIAVWRGVVEKTGLKAE